MSPFDELLSTTPCALKEYVILPKLGGEKVIFEGEFTLKEGEKDYIVHGRVYYSFCEKIELLFEGETIESVHVDAFEQSFEISVGDSINGNALVTQIQGKVLKGFVLRFETKIPTSCQCWRWCYLNGPQIFGHAVRRDSWKCSDRLVFRDGDYQVIIENKCFYKQQKEHREISHFCELRRRDGQSIFKNDALDEILLFSRFVSFFAGCQHAPFFIEGLDEDNVIYSCHCLGNDRSLVSVSSWKPAFKDQDLIALWPLFRAKRYESQDQYDVLNTVIHWYIEANMNSGLLEGAFLLGFTGIELISKELVGKELRNREIIEDFISRLHLDAQMNPEDLSTMRNYLVHYKSPKRRFAYTSLSYEDKNSRIEMLLQMLELAILYWLGYEGHYCDRRKALWRGEVIKIVPWHEPVESLKA